VPDTIGNLTALTTLGLSNNRLTAVPDTIGNLTALTTLDLSNNQLNAVPKAIGNLTSLAELELCGNPILERQPDTRTTATRYSNDRTD